ncbi:hypothetical protein M011DRAFT_407105 [Sporormia fimetaria CBS 119925]|uniref:Uncharacterized protein n=1 Tax=Sporormia fimetaria CBS 119925 TaxID=1340428 RepID=A0A6A6V3N1_9PLEO|nr:hypothetical protein M011DRAFT_407105 [Sporormia fimetaria CBS 119925]
MPAAAVPEQKQSASSRLSTSATNDAEKYVRLHITPFTPALSKVYLAPSVQSVARNISYHSLETFPEKGFGYVDLPEMEATKLKKKLNGSTLKGSKVKIETAKPEKRKKLLEEAEEEEDETKVKKAKRAKVKKEQGVLEGIELPEGRKVKRGWTETKDEKRKAKKEKKDKMDKKEKPRKESKYTREPELLFNAKLTPVAATEVVRKEKKKDKKKDKKDKKSSREVVVHEFENNTKQPSFLKAKEVITEAKPAVEYINGKGWVDEDGNVVEAETGKARNRRVLELVEPTAPKPTIEKQASKTPEIEPLPKATSKAANNPKKRKVTPTPSSSSESEGSDAESSILSPSSEEPSSSEPESESESEVQSDTEPTPQPSHTTPPRATATPEISVTPSSPSNKEVHPLEALFKRPKPSLGTPTSTPAKSLAPINTTFSFFGVGEAEADGDTEHAPLTPFTQKDLEWRGQRSAAPTPDTAVIGRRFSFDWRKGSVEDDEDEDEDMDGVDEMLDSNTKANAALHSVPEDKDAGKGDGEEDGDEKEESEFAKWFWEHRGENNRAWKKKRRDTLKARRLRENRKVTGGRRV